MEKIVEIKVCKWTGEKFPIYKGEKEMLNKLSPIISGEKFNLPIPDLSPKAREINRLMFRNERKFYKIKLENKKEEISTIHPIMRKNIVNIEDFNETNFIKYQISYSGNFMHDYRNLIFKAPNSNLINFNMENSFYCNRTGNEKNCYLNSGGESNENCMYNTFSNFSKNCIDNYWIFNSEIVYDSLSIFNSFKIFFSNQVKDSYNIYFGYDLIGCQNIIFGNNLHNKNYIYKNKVLGKEKWLQKQKEFKNKLKNGDSLQKLKKEYDKFLKNTGKKEVFIDGSENSVGNIIINSKNSFNVFFGKNNENTIYSNISWDTKDSMDLNSFAEGSKLYNIANSYKIKNCISGSSILNSSNIYYSFELYGVNHMFGCFGFGLKNKEYFILNKKYSKENWEKLVSQIIEEMQKKGQWGRFLKPELSPYPYNDSVAMEYYPIKKAIFINKNKILKEEIIREEGEGIVYILEQDKFISKAIIDFGGEEKINTYWRVGKSEINIPKNLDIILGKNLPEIEKVDNNILKKAIICEKSLRPFRIIKKELEFYKKYSLPLPKIHYDERHLDRIKSKNINCYRV